MCHQPLWHNCDQAWHVSQGTCVTGMAGLLAGGAAAAAGGLAGRASTGTFRHPSTLVSALALSRTTVADNAEMSLCMLCWLAELACQRLWAPMLIAPRQRIDNMMSWKGHLHSKSKGVLMVCRHMPGHLPVLLE